MMDYNNPNRHWMPDRQNSDTEDYNPEDREREIIRQAIRAVCIYGVAFVIGLLMCWLLSGCTTTRYVPVIEHHTDTLRQTNIERDSIYLSDSIYVSDFVRDDTVYRTEYRWRTKYIERIRVDTTYVSRRDTVSVVYEVPREVPAPLSKTQKGLQLLGVLTLLGGIIFAAVKIRRFLP